MKERVDWNEKSGESVKEKSEKEKKVLRLSWGIESENWK